MILLSNYRTIHPSCNIERIMKNLAFIALLLMVPCSLYAQDAQSGNQDAVKVVEKEAEKPPVMIELAGGSVVLEAPEQWKQVRPRFPQMVQYEFHAPADAKEGEPPVRITVMASGGGLQGNLERWSGQFSQPDGKATKEVAQVSQIEVKGPKVHFVQITGTYSGGMMPGGRPAQPKPNHQLVSGIIETEKDGTYFITANGPKAECEKLVEGFREMLKNLKTK
jgi:hypothetical protein